MKPKILIPVDGSSNSRKAVEHVGDVLHASLGGEIILFHVVVVPRSVVGEAACPIEQSMIHEEWREENLERVEEEIFAPAKQTLKEKGVQEDAIAIREDMAEDTDSDVAMSIIRAAHVSRCDAVVLGGRGMFTLRGFVFGSVVSRVVHHLKGCAVWIVE